MIANLFEEYNFFSKYPERQLRIAAVLFGEILFTDCSNVHKLFLLFEMVGGVLSYDLCMELLNPLASLIVGHVRMFSQNFIYYDIFYLLVCHIILFMLLD